MAMISKLAVEKFRGINNLKVDNLNRVNLFVGDNNCGKTSVMEALQLFRTSELLGNIYSIARQRESIFWMNSNSLYENFICMFPHDGSKLEIKISGICNGKEMEYDIQGKEEQMLIDVKELDKFFVMENAEWLAQDSKIEKFEGMISYKNGEITKEQPIEINRLTGISGTPASEADTLKIIYVAPFEHLKGSVIGQIIKNDGYKAICLKALQLFDFEIEDMMIFRSDVGNRPVEYLKHKRLGNMPLSTFGDGIKKVLVLSNAIAKAAGGILLIDEIETAIHKKYYDDIYRFCYYKTGNSSLSYDLAQETFLKLIKYIGTYKHRGKFKSYLITIAMNVCNTYFDKNKVELEELDDNQTYKENDSNELSRIEQKNSIDKALKELPEKQKEVIILKYYEDLKIKDISKILDEKVPTIKSRLKQGIEKLSRYLGKEDF